MQIDGLTYLLTTETNGMEYVLRYSQADMEEIFTGDDRRELDAGEAVIHGTVRYVDMLVAARSVIA